MLASSSTRSFAGTDVPDDDADLVAAFRATGRLEEFERLVERHKGHVFRLAVAVLGKGHERDAEDVAQEVFLQAYRRIHTFEGRSRFSTWLYRITYNRALDYRRSLRAKPEVALIADYAAPTTGPDCLRSKALLDCLSRLPDAQRTAIHLHYWLGHTMQEIAVVFGVQSGTAKIWLFRARHLLARCLSAKGVRP